MDPLPSSNSPVFGRTTPRNQPDVETQDAIVHSPATTQNRIDLFAKKLRSIPPISSPDSKRGSFSGKLFSHADLTPVKSDDSDSDSLESETPTVQPCGSPVLGKTNQACSLKSSSNILPASNNQTVKDIPFLQLNDSSSK